MEVHHHSHREKKKWTGYLWEFTMLFLAVFCGFLAEYKLEHVIEHDREKQYIRSLIADLKENDVRITESLIAQQKRIAMMDSMITILNDPASIKGNESSLYYFARVSPRNQPVPMNTRTFEQLKNSGNFRLITDIEISNKIMTYFETIPGLRMVEELYQKEFDQYKILASRIFDPGVFIKMETQSGNIIRTEKDFPLQSYDISTIKQFTVFAVYMNGSGRGVLLQSGKIKDNGEEMISYLKQKYHLK